MNKLIVVTTFLITLILLAWSCGSQKSNKKSDPNEQDLTKINNPENPMPAINDEKYLAEWKTIDSLENQGLPKSALEKLNELYEVVLKDRNPSQLIKCLIYRGKYESRLEEDGVANAIVKMQTEMDAATFPVKPLLQSMLAEMYSKYLNNNYYTFSDRTQTANFKSDDIKTWTVEQLVAESRKLYLQSVSNVASQEIEIAKFDAILIGDDKYKDFRPTLYDFLMHRAIDYLTNENSYLTEPAYKFHINQKEAFGDVNEFINYKFETNDEQSPKYRVLLLLQDLLKFHQKDSDPKALIEIDLKRLKFVHDNAILGDKDELYLKALTDLEAKYSTIESATEINYYIANYYFLKGQNYTQNPEEKGKWDYKKAYEICEKAIEKHPDSFGAEQCQSLKNRILSKDLSVKVEQVNLPNRPLLGHVSFRNISKSYFKIASVSQKEEDKIRSMPYDKRNEYLHKMDPLKFWSVDLPQEGDFRSHSVEIKIDPLSFGRYIIIGSNVEKFDKGSNGLQYAFFHVSNISYQSRKDENGKSEFVVMNRETGQPMEGVDAEFYIFEYNQRKRVRELKKVGEAKSNDQGFVFSPLNNNQTYQVKFSYGKDELFLTDRFSDYYYNQNNSQIITHFFLDRAIYRPGQNVYFKGILIEKDDENMPSVYANQKVTITFYDANRQKVSSLDLTTNEYGSVSGSFVAPDNGLLGNMRLQSSIGRQSSIYFRVEEYKRPKFEVTFQPIEGSFKLNEKVSVKGNAKAFAGSNIDGADVSYRVVRQARFPFLPWWYWRGFYPSSPSMEIAFGETKTDEKGEFTIDFEAIPDLSIDPKAKPEFVYTVYADVIDITGETHSSSKSVSVGYIALRAGFDLSNQANVDSLKVLLFTLKT